MVNFLSDTHLEGEPRGETFSTGRIAAEKHQRSILPICEIEGNKTIKVQSVLLSPRDDTCPKAETVRFEGRRAKVFFQSEWITAGSNMESAISGFIKYLSITVWAIFIPPA